MELSHKSPILRSRAMQHLGQFVLDWQGRWEDGPPDFEHFEHELHEHIMAIERELLTKELNRYDVTAKQVEDFTFKLTDAEKLSILSRASHRAPLRREHMEEMA